MLLNLPTAVDTYLQAIGCRRGTGFVDALCEDSVNVFLCLKGAYGARISCLICPGS